MLQYSVYARVCNGMDAVEKHRQRVKQNLPENGAIRLMVITEKQYEAIDILLGKLTEADDKFQCEQLSIFERKVAQGIALSDFSGSLIIPYQELPGNYNMPFPLRKRSGIIPCKDLTVRTPALLLGNFCVAFSSEVGIIVSEG